MRQIDAQARGRLFSCQQGIERACLQEQEDSASARAPALVSQDHPRSRLKASQRASRALPQHRHLADWRSRRDSWSQLGACTPGPRPQAINESAPGDLLAAPADTPGAW